MIQIRQLKLMPGHSDRELTEKAARTLRIRPEEIASLRVVRQSIDARKKPEIRLIYTVDVKLVGAREEKVLLSCRKNPDVGPAPEVRYRFPEPGKEILAERPLIIGTGPAGLFCGYLLAKAGYRPLLLERGEDVESRTRRVEEFWKTGVLSADSNVQFGEGGAGTFSDGKLNTLVKDKDGRNTEVLKIFVENGAPEEIRYRQKPHVGTDLLRGIVKSIREEIIRLGGQVRFGVKMERLLLENGRLYGVKTSEGELPAEALVLAIGHSARDTFEALEAQQVFLEPKPFSVGVRIEQRQQVIDYGLYGAQAGHPLLPKGEYQLSWRDREGRGVYTFCMCPGGFVVASSSEENTVVTNGMSEYARDGENANSALVVSVDAADYGAGPLAGMAFQRKLERGAFLLGGSDYRAPAQSVKSFLEGSAPDLSKASVTPTYSCGVKEAALRELFPQQVNRMLEEGLRRFNHKLPGFADADAVMTGAETRTSSPVRITRSPESLQALGIEGLYPCGEGAGYAGGIMSAAVDGVRVAEKIMEIYG